MRHRTINPNRSVVFLPQKQEAVCRCGAPSLDEACAVCEQYVCTDCAVFVDPQTKQPTRPSTLMAQGVTHDFLAHRICLLDKEVRLFPVVYGKDVAFMVRMVKGHSPLGKTLGARARTTGAPRYLGV